MCIDDRVACLRTGRAANHIGSSHDFDDIRVQYEQQLLHVQMYNGARHGSSTITLGYSIGGHW
jgi:hypothetical protein